MAKDVFADAAQGLLEAVVTSFQDDLGDAPTFAEFLEILEFAAPTDSPEIDIHPGSLQWTAKVGRQRYGSSRESRVAELNDATFAEAVAFIKEVGDHVSAATGHPANASTLAEAVLEVLKGSGIRFADVSGSEIYELKSSATRRSVRPKAGDIVAIPIPSGYRMAIVVTRNRFGTALGLLGGATPVPRVSRATTQTRSPMTVYTDGSQFANGAWFIVGHDETLLRLFPSEPEIYHRPNRIFPNVDLGEFGAAESPSGALRKITEEEANHVGLADNSYKQVTVSTHLQQMLANSVI